MPTRRGQNVDLGISRGRRRHDKINKIPRKGVAFRFKDIPLDVLHLILGSPKSKFIKRREFTDSLKFKDSSTACQALFDAYKAMYSGSRHLDLTIPNILELDSYPVMPSSYWKHIGFIIGLIGPTLEVIKIPQSTGCETVAIIMKIATTCPFIHTVSFTDSGVLRETEALFFLNACRTLRTLEVSDPGPEFMLALEACQTSIQNLSLLCMRRTVFLHNLKYVLIAKGDTLVQLTLGEHRSSCYAEGIYCGLHYFFHENRCFVLNWIPSVQKLRINVARGCCGTLYELGIGRHFLAQIREVMTLEVILRFESFLFFQVVGGANWKRYNRFLRIETYILNPEHLFQSFEESYPIKNPDSLVLTKLRWLKYFSTQEYVSRRDTLLNKVRSSIQSIVLPEFFSGPNICRIACELLSFYLSELPGVETLYVSFEIVAYTYKCSDFVTALARKMKNVKAIHLICHNKGHKGKSCRVGYPRFVRNLSPFLSIMEKHCPTLEVFSIERGNSFNSSQEESARAVLLRKAIKRVDTFESKLPKVDASTVREQLLSWQRESNEEP